MNDALTRIAELAPTLSQSEVRVLLELTRRAITTGATDTSASSRELAAATKVSRRNVQSAIDELNSRGIVTSDRGSATRPAAHTLELLKTVPIGRGANTAPPQASEVALNQRQGGVKLAPPVALQQRQSGVTAAPPKPTPITQARAHAFEIFDPSGSDKDRSTLRLLNAKPTDYDAASISAVKSWIESYKAKFGKADGPPDEKICAELLAVADLIRLENLIYALQAERKQAGESYAWFVTVAVQRIWGWSPEEYRERRKRLAPARKPPIPQQFNSGQGQAATGNKPATPEMGDLRRAMAAAAAAKGMR